MTDLPILLPAYGEILLLVMASVILLVDLFLPERLRGLTYWLSLATLTACFEPLSTGSRWSTTPRPICCQPKSERSTMSPS